MSHNLTRGAVFAVALHACVAHADDAGAPLFSLGGFGTVGVVRSTERNADFTASLDQAKGAGHSQPWSTEVDSRLGVQLIANVTPQFSAVLQVISEQNQDNTYRPHVEWANIKYQFTPDFSVRVGRAVLPTFLLSDSRKVAYTYPWVRPPLEVYSVGPLTSSDGLNISYRLHFGELTNTVQANVSRASKKVFVGYIFESTRLRNFSNTTEYGAATIRVSYLETDLTVASLTPVFDAFRQFGAQGTALADKYNINAKYFNFIGIGASYDPGNWFVMSEWGRLDTHSVLGKRAAWYASGGYRLGNFTPYITYAQTKADNSSDPGLDVTTLPSSQLEPAIVLNGILNSILSMKPVQNTMSVGGRWDFSSNAALNVQYDRTHIGPGSPGLLRNLQPEFHPGGRVNLLSVAVKFVF